MTEKHTYTLEWSPAQGDIQAVRAGLSAFNLAQRPDLARLPDSEYAVVARDASGAITGGALCEYDWGWLYVDTLWVAESARGRGLGTRILQTAEAIAYADGIQRAYLLTTSFQARPFYEALGYRVFGTLAERPPGHTMYYLANHHLAQTPDPQLHIEKPSTPPTQAALVRGLLAHSAPVAPLVDQRLAVFLRDQNGRVRGGAVGTFYWQWYDLRFLWVDETLRGQGHGTDLLRRVEVACRRQRALGIVCDTVDWQAPDFYRRHGFTITGTLRERPPGAASAFMHRRLV